MTIFWRIGTTAKKDLAKWHEIFNLLAYTKSLETI